MPSLGGLGDVYKRQDLTATGLEEHTPKDVRLGDQDTVGRGLEEESDERALRVDVGVGKLGNLEGYPVVRRRGPRVVSHWSWREECWCERI